MVSITEFRVIAVQAFSTKCKAFLHLYFDYFYFRCLVGYGYLFFHWIGDW